MKKQFYQVTICFFTAFLIFMGVLYAVLPKSDYSETEKRYLQTFPEFSFQRLKSGEFTADFSTFLADQTPLRRFFVGVNAYYNIAIGNNGSNGVYLGKNGWLIEKPAKPENVLNENVARIVAFARQSEMPVLLTVVPQKGFACADSLPRNALAYNDAEYCEQISSLTGNKVSFVDLSKRFKQASASSQLYYKTDHHWTSTGAYTAYSEICAALGLDASPKDNYEIESVDGFFGTSYSTSGYLFTKPDSVEVWRNKRNGGAAELTIEENGKTLKYDNMFFDSRLSQGDKYPVFLDGNHSLVRIKTGNRGGRLLLIKDSFAHCLAPFLAENYSEIIMVDLRYYKKSVKALAEDENITQIMLVYGMKNLVEDRVVLR